MQTAVLEQLLNFPSLVSYLMPSRRHSHPIKGSSIGVYGTNLARANENGVFPAPACLYTIDEGTPVRLTSNQTNITIWGQPFFLSPVLPIASHVLTIEYDDNFRTKTSLLLDYFMVDDGTLSSAVPSSSLTASFLSSTTATSSTTPQPPVFSPSFSTPESSSSSPTLGATPGVTSVLVQGGKMPKLPTGPIIGGALGAITFICTVLLILYLRRRRREGHSDENIGATFQAIGKNSQFLQYMRWLIMPNSLDPGRPQITPYDISQPPPYGDRGKPSVGMRMGMAATQVTVTSGFATGAVQRAAQQIPAAATSSTLGSMTDPNNLDGMPSIPGDPPPSYREESLRPR
jgi:hypothetical protein